MPINTDRIHEYKAGSILRVHMINFLTYREVEVCPGPRLNVVCGPNGSGKSTVLCAMCLGLGGQPPLLGRADDVKLFIMHEQDYAVVEIELAPKADHPDGEPNDIITRKIIRSKGKSNRGASEWEINGKKSNHNEVRTLVESYDIAVGNLCTFLPQDRVGSFSGFNAQKLLNETQHAIGGGLVEDQNRLIDLEQKVTSNDRSMEMNRIRLEQLYKERSHLEKEKDRMEERQACLNEIELLEKKRMWLQFEEQRSVAVKLNESKKEAKTNLNNAKKSLAPTIKVVEKLEQKCTTYRAAMHSKSDEVAKAARGKDGFERKIAIYSDAVEDTASEIEGMEEQRRRELRKVDAQRAKVQSLEEKCQSLPDVQGLKAAQNEARMEWSSIKKEHNDAKRAYNAKERRHSELAQKLSAIEKKYERISNDKVARRNKLFSKYRNLAETSKWVEENSKRFRKAVFGPIVCEIQISDENVAAYVEQHVPLSVLKSYVVQCREDYDLLYHEIRQKLRLPINIQLVSEARSPRRLYTEERMQMLKGEHGVVGYLDEAFSANEFVMEAIRDTANVQSVLVGTAKTQASIDKHNLLRTLGTDETGRPKSFCIFACDRSGKSYKYMGNMSRYSGKINTSIDEITHPRMLAPGVSNMEKEELKQAMFQHRKEVEEIQPDIDKARVEYERFVQLGKEAESRYAHARETIGKIQKYKNSLQNAKNKLDDMEEEANRDTTIETRSLQKKLKNVMSSYVSALRSIADANKRMMDADGLAVGLKMTENILFSRHQKEKMKLDDLQKECLHFEQSLAHVQNELSVAKGKLRQLKQAAEHNAPLVDYQGNELPLKAQLEELPSTLSEIEALIEENQMKVDAMVNNPGVIQAYMNNVKEIEELEKERDKMVDGVQGAKQELETTLNRWKSNLQNTMNSVNEKFGEYMKDLNCAGEVGLLDASLTLTDDGNAQIKQRRYDFQKWGVEIRVQFRDSGSLQVLSAQRHSGGERSVSTIMYMMALQDLIKSPFRCVDEINQGLDERNERLVFERIVKNSTGNVGRVANDHSGQYFLITPKLLPNLKGMDNDDITAHIVMNGPYNFRHCRDWDVSKFLMAAASRKRESCVDEVTLACKCQKQ